MEISKELVDSYSMQNNGQWAKFILSGNYIEKCAVDGRSRHCGRILINSSFGTYTHYWSHCGMPFEEFLCSLDFDYAMGKFVGNGVWVFDKAASLKAVKQCVIEHRRHRWIEKDFARKVWRGLGEISAASEQEFIDQFLRDDALSEFIEEPWYYTKTKVDDRHQAFWDQLWVPFMQFLKSNVVEAGDE